MTDREKLEKVIKGLECIISSGNAGMKDDCANCVYPGGGDCIAPALRDAIALLKGLSAFKAYFDDLYGEGLEVANWHMNGATEPFDNFYDSAMEEYENA